MSPAVVNIIPQPHMHLNIEFNACLKLKKLWCCVTFPNFSDIFPCFSNVFPWFPMVFQWFPPVSTGFSVTPVTRPQCSHLVARQGHRAGAWAVAFRALAVGKGAAFRFAAVGVVSVHFEEVGMALIVLEMTIWL